MPLKPRTFQHFPPNVVCPACGTSEDDECILLAIDGTRTDTIAEAQPVHLWCAIAEHYNRDLTIFYRVVTKSLFPEK
jgi:hypothetical protein